jgi:hypothetical protein
MLCAGQVYRSTLTISGQTGAPSSSALAITKPDGTLVSPAPAPGAGSQVGANWVVTYDYTLPTPGRFVFTWTTTGPGTAPLPDVANVRGGTPLAGLAEVKAHLGKTSTTDDDELAAFMLAATELVESKVGACTRTPYTERVYDHEGQPGLQLSHRPLSAVTSVAAVTAGGQTWAAGVLSPDTAAGIVWTADGSGFWGGPWDVVYECARQVIPERFLQAYKEQIRHLWDTQRGAAAPSVLAGEEVFTTSAGFTFSVPRRVIELLQADMVPTL